MATKVFDPEFLRPMRELNRGRLNMRYDQIFDDGRTAYGIYRHPTRHEIDDEPWDM